MPGHRFTIFSDDCAFGPVPWSRLREWLSLGWLPATDLLVRLEPCGQPSFATSFPFLFTTTAALRQLRLDFEIIDLAGERVAITAAQVTRLKALGWPGDCAALRNYYWADKLRAQLEREIFHGLPTFHDDEWPACWGGPENSPANVERREAARPPREETIARRRAAWLTSVTAAGDCRATNRQLKVLVFFGAIAAGDSVSFRDAMRLVPRLLADEDNAERWEAYKRLTGDVGHESSALVPYDSTALAALLS